MKEHYVTAEVYEIMRRSMEQARERGAMSPPRDVLKREHDEAQRRPNPALEKWGPPLEAAIERDLERSSRTMQPNATAPDIDMD